MKLFLCGGGSGNNIRFAYNKFANIIDKTKPILYVPLAMDDEKYPSCYEWFKSEIKYFNISKFDMVKSSKELSEKNFDDYCAIFIGGGNTYKLLKELKENSNMNKINDYLNNDGIVFGGSAGAIVFGNNIDSCLNDDGNIVNLQDLNGFNCLNNFSILCHLNKCNLKKNKDYLLKYSNKYKTIYLPEEDVLVINDNKIEFIGNKKYAIFNKGKYNIHNYANIKKDLKIK